MVTYPNYYQNYPNYQQQYQQPMQVQPVVPQPIQPIQTQNQLFAWVKDEKEALDFPLSAGQSIFLMNQNDDYLYAKSVDQLGKSKFIKKRLVDESDNTDKHLDLKEYIRREELDNLISDKIQNEIEKRMSQITLKPTKKKTIVEDDED